MDMLSQTDPYLRRHIRSARTAVIPVGSIEQHGPHLPVSTDTDIATEISKRLAKRLGALLLPAVRYGVSGEHAPLFQLSLSGPTLRRAMQDICMSISGNGITTLFVINGHHGNVKALEGLEERAGHATSGRLGVHVLSYWHFMQRRFDHAGFVETSIMLAISENVRMGLARKGLITDGMAESEIRRLGRLASRSFPSVCRNGVWGDPTQATRAAGRAMLAEIVGNLDKKCQICLTEDMTNLHQ